MDESKESKAVSEAVQSTESKTESKGERKQSRRVSSSVRGAVHSPAPQADNEIKPRRVAAMWGGIAVFLVVLLLPWPLYLFFSKGHYFNPIEEAVRPAIEEMTAIIYRSHDTSHDQEVSMHGNSAHQLDHSSTIAQRHLPEKLLNSK
jgi:hypothetical protein